MAAFQELMMNARLRAAEEALVRWPCCGEARSLLALAASERRMGRDANAGDAAANALISFQNTMKRCIAENCDAFDLAHSNKARILMAEAVVECIVRRSGHTCREAFNAEMKRIFGELLMDGWRNLDSTVHQAFRKTFGQSEDAFGSARAKRSGQRKKSIKHPFLCKHCATKRWADMSEECELCLKLWVTESQLLQSS